VATTSDSEQDKFLPARKVWERYGVTSMTLWRWVADPEMKFPAPTYLGRLRFWKATELVEWEARQPRGRRAVHGEAA